MDEDPGHILEIVRASESLDEAADKLGSTAEYLRSFVERFEEAEGAVDVEAFPLAAGEAIPVQQLPEWLLKPIPPGWRTKRRWPAGAKSPSWFRLIAKCSLKHAHKYRRKRPDPSGLDAIVGNALHGAFQDAALLRMHKRKGVPTHAGKEEMLFLLEKQAEVVHDRGTEVLKRARQTILDMEDDLELSNVWAAEYVWSFHPTPGMLVAGIADLVVVFPDPVNPVTGPPLLVVVVDYKTGPGQVPSQEELRADPQACLELIWAKRYFYSAKRVQFHLWNVTQNQRVTIDWDDQLERTTLAFVRACGHTWAQKTEKANVTRDCRYCPYRNDCKAFTQSLQAETYRPKDSLDEKEIDELAEVHYRSKRVFDLAETRKKDASKLILEKLGPFQTRHRTGRFLVMRKTRKLETFPSVSDTIYKLSEATGVDAGRIFDSCTSLGDGRKLRSWVQTLPEGKQEIAKDIIEALKQKRSSPPWIEVRESNNAGF